MYEEFIIQRLSKLRLAKDVSAREMSLAIGQNPNYINQVENGIMLPSLSAFFEICFYLKITPRDFFDDGTTNPALINQFVEMLKRMTEEDAKLLFALGERLTRKA